MLREQVLAYLKAISLKGSGGNDKNYEISFRIAGLLAKIRSNCLQNTSQKLYV
jgi:hypothetical protein